MLVDKIHLTLYQSQTRAQKGQTSADLLRVDMTELSTTYVNLLELELMEYK